MVWVMLYAENANVVGTYEAYEHAERDLLRFVNDNPDLSDEIGLRGYENGRPATDFRPATEIFGDRLRQQHFIDA